MKKIAKPLLILGFFLLGALLTLRVTGLDPEYMDYTTQEYNERGRMTLPGLWLSGEVVKEPIDRYAISSLILQSTSSCDVFFLQTEIG